MLDGAFLADTAPPVFRRIGAPTERELQALVEQIAERIGRALERAGLITRDCENTYLSFDPGYRVAVGPRTGLKVLTLRSFSAQRDDDGREGVAEYAGFSLHVCLKTPYRNGTTHIVLEPLDFMAWPRCLEVASRGGRAPKALRLSWMQRLKRVFAIEIETCQRCGGKLEVIASIEDAELIGRILEHRAQCGEDDLRGTPFVPRAPPQPPLL